MDTLDGTEWDMVISGTGLPQSLLALAVSRSGKKILHVDRNPYYGGNEAALSLDEWEQWTEKHKPGVGAYFTHAEIFRPLPEPDAETGNELRSSRAYSLTLAPQLLYATSNLVPTLVSSKVHNQLEFQAVGSWFIVDSHAPDQPSLTRVPNGREDIFADASLDLRGKRSLMKFLRFIANHEQEMENWQDYKDAAFSAVLENHFGLPAAYHGPLQALTLSPGPPAEIKFESAVAAIARHLRSIGIFGPGFGAVLPKWGGLAEICQVACRACAVGGGVYVLNKGLTVADYTEDGVSIFLDGGENIKTKFLACLYEDLLHRGLSGADGLDVTEINQVSRSVSVVSSPLTHLFPVTSEGGVTPAGAVVVVPSPDPATPPVHLIVHSSESGECPSSQCVIYASIQFPWRQDVHSDAVQHLERAVESLLHSSGELPPPKVVWRVQYQQRVDSWPEGKIRSDDIFTNKVVVLPAVQTDIVLEDRLLGFVKAAWKEITGGEEHEFMKFEARQGLGEDEE